MAGCRTRRHPRPTLRGAGMAGRVDGGDAERSEMLRSWRTLLRHPPSDDQSPKLHPQKERYTPDLQAAGPPRTRLHNPKHVLVDGPCRGAQGVESIVDLRAGWGGGRAALQCGVVAGRGGCTGRACAWALRAAQRRQWRRRACLGDAGTSVLHPLCVRRIQHLLLQAAAADAHDCRARFRAQTRGGGEWEAWGGA